eukprot:6704713-Prymnesium_polylepis.1
MLIFLQRAPFSLAACLRQLRHGGGEVGKVTRPARAVPCPLRTSDSSCPSLSDLSPPSRDSARGSDPR